MAGRPFLLATNSFEQPHRRPAWPFKSATRNAPAILVTKDINLRIKADSLGLPAKGDGTDRLLLTQLSPGMIELDDERRENVPFPRGRRTGTQRPWQKLPQRGTAT